MWAPSDSAITIGSRVFAVPRSIQGWMMCSRSCSRSSAVSYLKFVSIRARCPLFLLSLTLQPGPDRLEHHGEVIDAGVLPEQDGARQQIRRVLRQPVVGEDRV